MRHVGWELLCVFMRSTEGATCWLGIVMRIYEERRSREMWVEKDWVVLKKHRRCDMFGRENLTSFCGAPKVRNINSRVRSARKNMRNYCGSAEGAKLLLMERLLRPSQWQTTRLYSPDCSGILLRNEVQQKIQRKAGQNLKRSKNFLASHKINKKYISENEINE